MSDDSQGQGPKGPRSPGDMVSTMPVAIAELRERLANVDAQLSGVDNNLVRIAGTDPNATEEIRMTPGQRAQIDRAVAGFDDTDTQIPVASKSAAAALAEVDALLGEYGDSSVASAPLPPPPPPMPGMGMGRRETVPEFPVSPPALPEESAVPPPPTPPSAARGAGTPSQQADNGAGGGLRWLAVAVVLAGGGYFAWEATQAPGTAPQPTVVTPAKAPAPKSVAAPAPAPNPTPKAATAKPKVATPPPKAAPAPATKVATPAPKAALPASTQQVAAPGGAPPVAKTPPTAVPVVAPVIEVSPAATAAAASAAKPAVETPKQVAAVAVDKPTAAKPAPPVVQGRPVSRISDGDLLDALEAIRQDPPPKSIIRGMHYFISNEGKHHLWRDRVADIGGIMVGVGAEQNYLIAGWSRPDVLVLMDFDIYISWLHKAYKVAFEAANTPDELITLWRDEEGRTRLKELIVRTYGETGEVQDILRAVKFAKAVGRHLAKLKAQYTALKIPCFLTDQGQYDFIAGLWRQGRVLAIRGDLTGDRTLVDIAAFSRISNLPVRVLYTSNAEYYFRFNKGRFRDNIVGLPFDDRSVILRTDPHSGSKYRFYEQKSDDFVAWLERGNVSNVGWMGKHRTRREDVDDFVLDKLPEQVGRAR